VRGNEERSVDVNLRMATTTPNLNIPGLDRLPPEVRARVEQALQSSNLTPELRQQIERLFQPSVRFGNVKSVEESAIVLDNPLGGNDQRFTINEKTEIKLQGQSVSLSQLQPGMTALVITGEGNLALGIVAFPDR
jgi:hypothetical protein